VDPSPTGAELERLLGQLLRALAPAVPRGPAGSAVPVRSAAAQEDTGAAGWPGDAGPDGLPALSASEARALTELLAARGIAQGQLAGVLGLEKSTVSRLAAGLERRGWLRRGRDQANQRYIRLYLTPEGRAVAGRVWQLWQSRQARILAALSPAERAGLAAGLHGLIRGLAAEGLLAADGGPGQPGGGGSPGSGPGGDNGPGR
jgi:DNA-binding MarR family transcriptional regulator